MRMFSPSATLLAVLLLAACRTGQQQWGPFRGQVIDGETGKPIPGAHVAVTWDQHLPQPVQNLQRDYAARDTVTDASGRFEIARLSGVLTAFVREPGYAVFAPDYAFIETRVTPPDGRRFVDPTVILMRPLRREERCRHAPSVPSGPYRHLQRFREAVHKYRSELGC